jgi:hypothetical protein
MKLLPAQLEKGRIPSKTFNEIRKTHQRIWPMKEVTKKGSNYWYNNNLQLKLKV